MCLYNFWIFLSLFWPCLQAIYDLWEYESVDQILT